MASEDRTHDLRIMRPTRCQLRYRHRLIHASGRKPQSRAGLNGVGRRRRRAYDVELSSEVEDHWLFGLVA